MAYLQKYKQVTIMLRYMKSLENHGFSDDSRESRCYLNPWNKLWKYRRNLVTVPKKCVYIGAPATKYMNDNKSLVFNVLVFLLWVF